MDLILEGLLGVVVLAGLGWVAGLGVENEALKEGDRAPEVDRPAVNAALVLEDKKEGNTLNLQHFRNKKHVVLFFFPKAMTGGWTIEACGFRDRIEQFARLDTVVIGISTDTLETQKKFTAKEGLNYPLLADSDGRVAKAFGVLAGKTARRQTFIIDQQGVVAKIFPKVTLATHADEILDFIKTQLAKKK